MKFKILAKLCTSVSGQTDDPTPPRRSSETLRGPPPHPRGNACKNPHHRFLGRTPWVLHVRRVPQRNPIKAFIWPYIPQSAHLKGGQARAPPPRLQPRTLQPKSPKYCQDSPKSPLYGPVSPVKGAGKMAAPDSSVLVKYEQMMRLMEDWLASAGLLWFKSGCF